MPLTLILEDGTGKPDANSYAAVADGDAYHDGHLYAAEWTAANSTTKAAALVMATRLIDVLFRFRGFRAHATQALQWPRELARDDDALRSVTLVALAPRDEYFASDAVPKVLRDATIETARELIKANRTDDPEGEGLASMAITGSLSLTFDRRDRRPVIPHVAQAMLARLGDYAKRNSGVVQLIRT
jgi:hypothetical protein